MSGGAKTQPRHATPESVGARIARAAARLAAEDPQIARLFADKRPRGFRAIVRFVQSANGVSQVRVQRASEQHPSTVWYSVYDGMYVPVPGDDVYIIYGDRGDAFVIGVRGQGRPNETRLIAPGAAHVRKDSYGRAMETLGDDRTQKHYKTDGKTVSHARNLTTGDLLHLGDHLQLAGGFISAGAAAVGAYHRKTHNSGANRYEQYYNAGDGKGERLLKYHGIYEHGHYVESSQGKGKGGTWKTNLKELQHPRGHKWGDDTVDMTLADPTDAPTLSATSGTTTGSIQTGSLFAAYALLSAFGSTLAGPVATITTTAGDTVTFPALTLPSGCTGVAYYVSDGPDSPTLRLAASNATGAAQTITAYGSGATPPTANTTYAPNPTTALTLSAISGTSAGSYDFGFNMLELGAATGTGALPPATYDVGYAFAYPLGLSAISPLASVTTDATNNAIAVSNIPALPAGATALLFYMTPARSIDLAALRFLTNATTNTPFTILYPPPPGVPGWPSASSAFLRTPTLAPAPTSAASAPTTALPAGTYQICYAVNGAGGTHTVASPASSITITAGQAIVAGPVDLPLNAYGATWYMSQPGGTTLTQEAIVTTPAAQTFTTLPATTAATPPTTNTTPASAAYGSLVETHASGHVTRKYDGCAHHIYSGGTPHVKHCCQKHALHYDGSGVVQHVHHASGHKYHTGDHYHGVSSITEGTNCAVTPSGPYVRHSRDASCDNSHTTSIHDGTSEKVIKKHGPNRGHTVHDPSGNVVHHHSSGGPTGAGHKHHTGDHVHSAGGIAVGCDGTVTLSGNYQRKTVESDGAGGVRYAHYHQTTKVRHHHPTTGEHAFHLNGTAHVVMAAAGNGGKIRHKQHQGTGFHEGGDDGTGLFALLHAAGNRIMDHSGALHRSWANGHVGHTTDGYALRVYDGGQSAQETGGTHRVHLSSNTNASTLNSGLSTTDPGGAMLFYDPGNGKFHALHHEAGQGFTVRHSGGNAHLRGVGGTQTELHGDGGILGYAVNTSRVTGAGDGGLFRWRMGTAGYGHIGDDGAGKSHIKHYSGNKAWDGDGSTTSLYANNGTTRHVLDLNRHTWPITSYIEGPASDGSRLNVIGSNGAGAIKANSHSYTVSYTNTSSTIPVTNPQPPSPGTSGSGGGGCGNFGASGTADQPHFKIVMAYLWYGTNPGNYRHAGSAPSTNYHWGSDADTNGGSSFVAGWNAVHTFHDSSIALHGGTYSGPAWAGTATFKTEIVNT